MMAPLRSNRVAFRRAGIASVAIHLAVAMILLLALRSRTEPVVRAPGINTQAGDVLLRFEDAKPLSVQAPAVEPARTDDPPTVDSKPAQLLVAATNPRVLPREMLAVIHRSIAASNLQQVAASEPMSAVVAIHGALAPGQSIVYILDCSGSMGEHGKLARARAALVATLRAQPEGVRFQVIAYNSSARLILTAGDRVTTAARLAAAESKLSAIEPTGRSNHLDAVRLAAHARPDVILLVTDAGELARAQFAPILAGVGKPVVLCVARVTATGIETPIELR